MRVDCSLYGANTTQFLREYLNKHLLGIVANREAQRHTTLRSLDAHFLLRFFLLYTLSTRRRRCSSRSQSPLANTTQYSPFECCKCRFIHQRARTTYPISIYHTTARPVVLVFSSSNRSDLQCPPPEHRTDDLQVEARTALFEELNHGVETKFASRVIFP